jgi:hypothetical protein
MTHTGDGFGGRATGGSIGRDAGGAGFGGRAGGGGSEAAADARTGFDARTDPASIGLGDALGRALRAMGIGSLFGPGGALIGGGYGIVRGLTDMLGTGPAQARTNARLGATQERGFFGGAEGPGRGRFGRGSERGGRDGGGGFPLPSPGLGRPPAPGAAPGLSLADIIRQLIAQRAAPAITDNFPGGVGLAPPDRGTGQSGNLSAIIQQLIAARGGTP